MTKNQITSIDLKEKPAPSDQSAVVNRESVAFIHSKLDDAGLSPAEFRLFCHVTRRAGESGDCFASVGSIAQVCRMNAHTVRSAIKALISRGMISETRRDGKSTIYRTTPTSNWKPYPEIAPLLNEARGNNRSQPTPTLKQGATPSNPSPLSISHKGNPSKAVPTNKPTASSFVVTGQPPRCLPGSDLVDRCRELFGEAEMKNPDNHRQWSELAIKDPSRLEKVLNETANALKEGRIKTTAPRYAQDYYGRIK